MRSLISNKITSGERITDDEALWLYQEADLADLQEWATQVKTRFHNPKVATYLIMRIINYTNICVALCDYCSFYRLPKSAEGYVLTKQDIFDKIDEIHELGGDFVGFNGGHNPKLNVDWYCDLFSSIRKKYPDHLEFYAMTVAEMMYISKRAKMSYFDVATKLKEAGATWITGGGSEILTNEFRKRHSPLKYTADDYMQAQSEIIRAGVNTTATMVVGFDESLEERVEHLHRTRDLQDQTSGLFSFLTWTYKPIDNDFAGDEISHEDYLRHLAVCRIYLDNVKHIRTSVLTQNKNAFKGLHYGANDFDIPLEDEVTQKAGAVVNKDIEMVLQQAKDEGFEVEFRAMSRLGPKRRQRS